MCWSWKTSSCHKIQKLIVNFPSNVNLHSTIAKAFTSICLAFFNWMFPLKMLDYLRKCLAPIMSSFSHTQPAHPTHSKTESNEKRFEPLHLTSYQYPNQLKFNIFLFFVPFLCVWRLSTRGDGGATKQMYVWWIGRLPSQCTCLISAPWHLNSLK